MNALHELMLEVERHAILRAHSSLVQDARKELAAYKMVAEEVRKFFVDLESDKEMISTVSLYKALAKLDKVVK